MTLSRIFLLLLFVAGTGFSISAPAQDETAYEYADPNDNLEPLDPSKGLLFDSLFPQQPKRIFKECRITVIDSAEGVRKERIEVSFNEKGQPLRLQLFCTVDATESCREITCAYNGTLFYSMRSLSKSSDARRFFTCRQSGNETVFSNWGLTYATDTSGATDSRITILRNTAGRDSFLYIYTGYASITTVLSKIVNIEDTIEILTYDVTTHFNARDVRKSSVAKVVNEYSKAGLLLRRDVTGSKDFARHTYTYDAQKRLARYQLFSGTNAGDSEKNTEITFERNKTGDPTKVRYTGSGYKTTYLLEWK